jgi:predicted nucleotidyltransferase
MDQSLDIAYRVAEIHNLTSTLSHVLGINIDLIETRVLEMQRSRKIQESPGIVYTNNAYYKCE